jgi:hypothetical protein
VDIDAITTSSPSDEQEDTPAPSIFDQDYEIPEGEYEFGDELVCCYPA